jgi:hypothetical protein
MIVIKKKDKENTGKEEKKRKRNDVGSDMFEIMK